MLTDEERQEIQDAVIWVTGKHNGQTRKCGNLPYIVHPMAVLALIANDWEITNVVLWKGALGHDLREECPELTHGDVADALGYDAALLIEELTFIPDPLSDLEPHKQKRAYMSSFHEKSLNALIVKCADRICNTCDFLATNPEYAVKYWKKANDLFDAMFTRGDEIIEVYGESAFPKMKYTRTLLSRQLVR